MTGTLIGVGVGPGAPDLVTLRAAQKIAAAGVIAYPCANDGPSIARAIVADLIPPTAEEIAIPVPMQTDRNPAQQAYDVAAANLAVRLDEGMDVVVLCEGDPLFYGSFMYLAARLDERHEVEVVPGITSVSACSAVAGLPLVARSQILTIIPGTLPDEDLRRSIASADTFAIVKVGRHLQRLRDLLRALGLDDRAVFVCEATQPGSAVLPLARAPEVAPYFSMILVSTETDRWLTRSQ